MDFRNLCVGPDWLDNAQAPASGSTLKSELV
jgi:hypothetical protein